MREYQTQLEEKLTAVFPALPVEIEWAAMTDERGLYSPRLDAAVGPFATNNICIDEYDQLVREFEPLLNNLFDVHRANLRAHGQPDNHFDFERMCTRNRNARCFLAVEIENAVSRKHLMGGAINAAALGRIGLAVAWNQEKLRAFVRMRSYLLFLAEVGKNTFDPSNLLILSKQQVMEALDSFLNSSAPTRRSPEHER
ncbi:MAG: hypothetical protein HZB95_03660 [Nitrosomonadales bacterium]|nr:hypothetical protein [Nitrosomonadales bacterium]